MRRLPQRLSFTLRQQPPALAVWALAAGGGTLAGPFGTFDALDWPARFLYWAGVAAVAVALSLGFQRLHRRLVRRIGGGTVAAWGSGLGLDLVYALLLGGLVHALNTRLFAGWGSWADYLWLVGLVLAVTVAVALLRWIFGADGVQVPAEPAGDPVPKFLARLAPDRRGALVRIEAQDHYLRVVTAGGSDLVLMRMADAEAALGDAGLRVHRSHWVARAAVRGLRRDGGRWRLEMADGAEVPVSRGYRTAVAAAGIIPAG